MHIYKINLHAFKGTPDIKIHDLERYSVREDLFDDSMALQIPSRIKIEKDSYYRRYKFNLSKSEILNHVLHMKVWRDFLEKKKSWCMIIESNVKIDASFKSILNTIETIPEGWDVFFPYDAYTFYEMNKSNQGISLLNPNFRENSHNDPYLSGFQWSNSCYFISRKGARKLLRNNLIKDRLDDTLLALSSGGELDTYTEEVSWFNFNNINRWENPERKQIIWNTVIENSSWTDLSKARVRELLRVVSKVANELNIDLVLQGGTHLGYIRHGGIMPWDDDVDVGIDEKKTGLFFDALTDHGKGFRFGSFTEPGTNCIFYKVWHKNGETITNHEYTFPFIDIWLYNVRKHDLVFKNGIICKDSAKKNFIPVSFENSEFKIPYNSIEVLDTRYSDWKTKIRIYSYSHRLEKSAFQPLTFSIKVTTEGRMVMDGLQPEKLLYE